MRRQRDLTPRSRPRAIHALESDTGDGAGLPSTGQAIPTPIRESLEPSFGHSFANVRVFNDSPGAAAARSVGAAAVATGENIAFAEGAYQPESPRGRHLLAHELAHVVQQRNGAGSTAEGVPTAGTREQEARAAADAALIGAPAAIAAGSSGVGRLAAQDDATKETEGLRAERIVGQFPWMAGMFPGWAFTAGPGGVRAVKTDGMTTVTRSADASFKGGFSGEIGQRRVTEADQDHAMESGQKLGWSGGAGFVEWMSGGRSLAEDGTKQADQTSQRLMVGPGMLGGRSMVSSTQDTVTKSRTTDAMLKDGTMSVGMEFGRQFALDDDNQLSSSTGVKFGTGEVGFARSTGSRIKDIDTGAVDAHQTSFGAGWSADQGFNAQYGKETATEIDGQKFASGTNVGVSTKGFEFGRTNSQTVTGADGKETGTSSAQGVAVNFDGSVGYNVAKQDAQGNKTSASIGVGLDPNNPSVSASVTRNGWTVSAKAGSEVHASEPRAVGDHWVVDWEKKLTAAGGGGAKGVGVSAGVSDSESGTRTFKTQAEAEAFRKNAAELLPSASHDPTTVDGAMYLAIGESRGAGSTASGGVSLSASPTAGSIGVGASSESYHNVQVTRLSPSVFELTYAEGDKDSLSLSASTLGIGATAHSSDKTGKSRTVRVDVATPDGRAAFEKFTQNQGALAEGARLISESQMKGHDSGQNFGGPGFDHDRTGFTEEEVTQDQRGKTERYTGGTRDEFESRIWGAKGHSKMSLQLDQTEVNDRDSTSAIHGSVDATEGRASFQHLADITGTVTNDASKAKSSGKWGVELELTEKIVDDFMASIGTEKIRKMGIFDGSDARNELRERLRDAKTSDDRKRAMASFFADAGYEGEALNAVRHELYGTPDRFHDVGYEMMKRKPGENFHYDLSLPGDRNFRGLAGRKELEAKIEQLDTAIKQHPEAAGSLHGAITETLTEVRRQRSEVADPKRYTDLPDELRENQVARLDQYIGQLVGQAQQAGTAFTAQDAAAVEADTAANPKGGAATGLAHIRREMGITDKDLGWAKGSFAEARESFMQLQKAALRGHGDLPAALGSGLTAANKIFVQAEHLRAAAEALEPSVTTLRSQYIEALGAPDTAAQVGAMALGQLTLTQKTWESAAMTLWQAEGELRGAVESR